MFRVWRHSTWRRAFLRPRFLVVGLVLVWGCHRQDTAKEIARDPQDAASRIPDSLAVSAASQPDTVAPSPAEGMTPEPASPPSVAARTAAAPAPSSPAAPRPAPASVAVLASTLNDPDHSEEQRLEAAERLLRTDVETLVAAYGQRDNPRLIRTLIEQCVAVEDTAVMPLLVGLFEQVGGEERIDFEHYILQFGQAGESAMLGFLHRDDRSLVMRALDTLAKMRSTAAADTIAGLLTHPDPWIRMAAAHAAGQIGGPNATVPLLAALDDTVYSVVNAALVGLGRIADPASYEPITVLLEDDNPHVRKHAAMALGQLGDSRALPAVRALAEEDPDAGVRFMAGRAVAELEKER